jgi:hypothetical protein
MNTTQIANRLIELCRKGEFVQAEQELYAADIEHIEIDGTSFKGFDDVLQKEVQFLEQLIAPPVVEVSEPLVVGNYFTIRMKMQCEHTKRGKIDMEELLLYKVANGKIVYLKCFI